MFRVGLALKFFQKNSTRQTSKHVNDLDINREVYIGKRPHIDITVQRDTLVSRGWNQSCASRISET